MLKNISNIIKLFLKNKIITENNLDFAKILLKKKEKLLILIIATLHAEMKQGSSCLPIENILKKIKKQVPKNKKKKITKINILKSLLKFNMVSIYSENNITPIIIFNNKIYLYKIWKMENKIAKFLNINKKNNYINYKKLKININNLFNKIDKNLKIAAKLAITKKITFIMGGPGTGKTTLIKKIIILLIYNAKKKINIKLATPTGKSAAKLTEEINKKIINKKITIKNKKYIPKQAYTIHTLIGLDYYKNNIYYKKENKLNIDVLIIDESSMLDMQIISNIISAIPINTQIIFIGDKDQLDPIGIGNILSDIYALKKNKQNKSYINNKKNFKKNYKFNTLCNNIHILKKNYRFKKNSDIAKMAKAINSNNIIKVKNLLNSNTKNIKLINVNKKNNYLILINKFIKIYKKILNMLQNKKPVINIINYLNKYQLLCALKKGNFGTKKINNDIKSILIEKKLINYKSKMNKWYIGQPIIITKNNYNLKIYNGNIGIILLDKNKKPNIFLKKKQKNIKKIPIEFIKHYKSAWSITVHKAQGSEFEKVSLILPNEHIPILNKKLIYTAITRAKKKIIIYTNKKTLYKSIKYYIKRNTGLTEQINHSYKKKKVIF
ncbi:exodeoxyribonuclease V subunit alpha [Candidatus Purcelliella pentastirinorum]|uniref:exodeoxyribonuclease V subunit alpha n=1 Tax=Candidatus Purcelliella pentastirinorum TaxID=472834 RepID=UPI002367869C|nr:exodeoxyribonuclease V subunit alpha [Candidatus Purcelliella pentastirinorum]WDI79019.1 exodeoxyribonuclease V subunit alpha [Candidatus Purcelliella pentastirinorum]WDR80156.1 exodeoxyribonuclease V subunit alpha [Candidatus Purcelliella pentastirinorum]